MSEQERRYPEHLPEGWGIGTRRVEGRNYAMPGVLSDAEIEAAAIRGHEAFVATEHYSNALSRWVIIARAMINPATPATPPA